MDATSTRFGAVLSQLGDDGTDHIVAYGSRSLSKPERQYCVTWRELVETLTLTLVVVEF